MGDLAITVRLNGVLVEDRVLPVHSLVRIGDSPDAVVNFPGADVAVVRLGKRLALRGRTLEEGEEMEIALGATRVHLRHTHKFSPPSALGSTMDARFLVAAVLVLVVGSWIDAASYWLERQPQSPGTTPLAHLLDAFDALQGKPGTPRGASVRAAPDGLRGSTSASAGLHEAAPPKADGPKHAADDHLSGTGYYTWYRSAVLVDDQEEEATIRFLERPDDPAVRQVLARAAYNRDDHEAAVWHYRWLLERFPEDRTVKIRLARAEKRLGFHQREIDLYRSVLEAEPDNVEALSGLSVALVRVGRLDEAQEVLDTLLITAPMHPFTHVTLSMILAWKGQTEESVAALEDGFRARAQLSKELQVELRRDIALDPAFHSLRRDWHLRAMLLRHLGAAAPRPVL